ncbi:hypothetical protein HZB01_03135 [Candidatus Woesearchaeota archaeon]|nr:hypothetical protein [Candidatus Woesearchaeota archaeon]
MTIALHTNSTTQQMWVFAVLSLLVGSTLGFVAGQVAANSPSLAAGGAFQARQLPTAAQPSSSQLAPQIANCLDSDGGLNYYQKGKTSTKRGILAVDTCTGFRTLKEGYCENGTIKSRIYTCNFSCRDGVCIDTPPPFRFGTPGDALELYEPLEETTSPIRESEWPVLSSGSITTPLGTTSFTQELSFQNSSGKPLFADNGNDEVGDFLKFIDGTHTFEYRLIFSSPGLQGSVQSGQIPDFSGKVINIIGRNYSITSVSENVSDVRITATDGTTTLEFRDSNTSDTAYSHSLRVNGSFIPSGKIRIISTNNGGVFSLGEIDYILETYSIYGDAYIPPNGKYSDFIYYKQGMLHDGWDIYYDGLTTQSYTSTLLLASNSINYTLRTPAAQFDENGARQRDGTMTLGDEVVNVVIQNCNINILPNNFLQMYTDPANPIEQSGMTSYGNYFFLHSNGALDCNGVLEIVHPSSQRFAQVWLRTR